MTVYGPFLIWIMNGLRIVRLRSWRAPNDHGNAYTINLHLIILILNHSLIIGDPGLIEYAYPLSKKITGACPYRLIIA